MSGIGSDPSVLRISSRGKVRFPADFRANPCSVILLIRAFLGGGTDSDTGAAPSLQCTQYQIRKVKRVRVPSLLSYQSSRLYLIFDRMGRIQSSEIIRMN